MLELEPKVYLYFFLDYRINGHGLFTLILIYLKYVRNFPHQLYEMLLHQELRKEYQLCHHL